MSSQDEKGTALAAVACALRLLAAGVLAGLLLALLDLLRLAPREPEEFEALALLLRRLLVLGLVLGLSLALLRAGLVVGRRLLAFAGRRRDLLLCLLGVMATAPLLVELSDRLLSGRGVSQLPSIEFLRAIGPFLLGSLLFALIRGVVVLHDLDRRRGPLFAMLSATGSILVAVAADRADARLFVGLYPELHLVLLAFAAFSAAAAFSLLLRLLPRRALVSVAVIVLALGAGFADRDQRADAQTRYLLFRKTLQGGRVLGLWQGLELETAGVESGIRADASFAAARREAGGRALALRAALDREYGDRRPRHLLWITLDTLRRDALGCYGAERDTSPAIDRLAELSVVFDRHWAQFPITSFSFQSTFFSRYPSATPLYRRMMELPDDPAGSLSFAARLGRAGFRTVSIPAVSSRALEHPAYAALGEGFAEIDPGGRPDRSFDAATQVALAEQVLDTLGDERLFLWLHLMDPHHGYRSHDEHPFGDTKRDRYDSEIAFADAAIGRLLARLRELGLDDQTLIVVNSDHGEAFGEHGTYFHGTTLYEEQIAVPAIIHLPGGPADRVARPTGNIDLVPTLHDLLGVATDAPMQGRSLAGHFIRAADPSLLPEPFAFAEIPDAIEEMAPANRDRQAIVFGRHKLIANRRDDFVELYDLRDDPGETFNLAARRPDLVDRLLGMIRVIRQESELVNVPLDQRPDEVHYAALRETLAAGPIPTRSRLLGENIRDDDPRMRAIVRERLADPAEHELIKLAIVDRAADLDGVDLLPAMRELIAEGRAIGTVAAVLDLWRRRALPLEGADRELVAAALLRHPQIGWRAARLLASRGDARSRIQLEPALTLGDDRTRFESACGLGFLGDAAAAPVLRAGLMRQVGEPELCAEAIRALARLGDRDAFPKVIALVRDRYRHHLIKEAALEYFDALEGDLALCGLSRMATGWDPAIGREIRARLLRRVGPERTEAIAAAALAMSDLGDLVEQGRLDQAVETCSTAADLLGSPEAALVCRLLEAGFLRAGDREEEIDLAAWFPESAAMPLAWRRYAEGLRSREDDPPLRLALLELEPTRPGPAPRDSEIFVRARIRNDGGGLVPGGWLPDAPIFRVAAEGVEQGAQVFPSRLALPGLAPGQTTDLLLRIAVPSSGDRVRLRLIAEGAAAIEEVFAAPAELRIAGSSEGGLDPRDLRFDGRRILAEWEPNPAFREGVLLPDGRVAYLARALDPILESPLLEDCGAPIEVEVRFRCESTDPERRTELEYFWRYPGQEYFLPQQSRAEPLELDGREQILRFVIEPVDGRSPRRIRLDFFQEPELVEIAGIRIRKL